MSGSYMVTLRICAILMMICSLLFACEPLARWWERRKIKQTGTNLYVNGPKIAIN